MDRPTPTKNWVIDDFLHWDRILKNVHHPNILSILQVPSILYMYMLIQVQYLDILICGFFLL